MVLAADGGDLRDGDEKDGASDGKYGKNEEHSVGEKPDDETSKNQRCNDHQGGGRFVESQAGFIG